MASIKDIANASGYSIATVSKALRNQPDVGKKTREKIKAIAREMDYFPNAAAQALKTKQSRNLGVLYKEETGFGLKHEYFAGVLQGFVNEAEQQGYDITFISTKSLVGDMSFTEHCKYRNFDGAIIVCAHFENEDVIELMESDLPVVTIDFNHPNCSSVSSNNADGITKIIEYAIEKGHKKIAYVHGENYSPVTKARVKAFKSILLENDIEIRQEYIKEAKYGQVEETEICTRELLKLEDAPTCILYPDDFSLIGGLNVIRGMGLKVPEDISIAGYDGCMFSQLTSPSLTTFEQDTDRIGATAAKCLIDIIENEQNESNMRIIIDGKLIEGQSIG